MGFSANQARFLSLTSRQIDLEYRMQQICHRRIRLASELENIATDYNNAMSDRKLFASTQAMYEGISLENLESMGYKVLDAESNTLYGRSELLNSMVKGTANVPATGEVYEISTAQELQDAIALDTDFNGYYVMQGDLDLSGVTWTPIGTNSKRFSGTFDGNGYSVSNLNLNSGSAPSAAQGFFGYIGSSGTVQNLVIEDSSITSTDGDNNRAGFVAGYNYGTVSNTAVINSSINLKNISDQSTNNSDCIGLLVGQNNSGTVEQSFVDSQSSITVDSGYVTQIGGLVGNQVNSSTISQSYSEADVTINNTFGSTNSSSGHVGGLVGGNYDGTIEYSYSTGAVTVNDPDVSYISGLAGVNATGSLVADIDECYTTSTVTYSGANSTDPFTINGTNGTSSELNLGDSSSWSSNWDRSTNPPTLSIPQDTSSIPSVQLEAALRSGEAVLMREADTFSQETISFDGVDYEKVDWRTVPTIDDDLDASNDVDAEAKYDSAIQKINSQDKKLQLEQSQIEVEHKAIVTQKDSVKSILDKNIEKSFKSFG